MDAASSSNLRRHTVRRSDVLQSQDPTRTNLDCHLNLGPLQRGDRGVRRDHGAHGECLVRRDGEGSEVDRVPLHHLQRELVGWVPIKDHPIVPNSVRDVGQTHAVEGVLIAAKMSRLDVSKERADRALVAGYVDRHRHPRECECRAGGATRYDGRDSAVVIDTTRIARCLEARDEERSLLLGVCGGEDARVVHFVDDAADPHEVQRAQDIEAHIHAGLRPRGLARDGEHDGSRHGDRGPDGQVERHGIGGQRQRVRARGGLWEPGLGQGDRVVQAAGRLARLAQPVEPMRAACTLLLGGRRVAERPHPAALDRHARRGRFRRARVDVPAGHRVAAGRSLRLTTVAADCVPRRRRAVGARRRAVRRREHPECDDGRERERADGDRARRGPFTVPAAFALCALLPAAPRRHVVVARIIRAGADARII